MSDLPCISCICPTRGRRAFLQQSLSYFSRQDYPNRELIIIDDSESAAFELEDYAPNVRYLWLSRPLTIGMKRNIACSVATGEIICSWDDDDWYGPHRLSQQAQPILSYNADATGLTMGTVFNIPTWQAWACSSVLHKELWAHDMVSGTLMFRTCLWGMPVTYPNKSIGEDADFIALLSQHGVRLAQVQNNGAFIYIRHSEQNVWPLPLDHTHPPMQGWQSVPIEQYLSESEQAFYASLAGGVA